MGPERGRSGMHDSIGAQRGGRSGMHDRIGVQRGGRRGEQRVPREVGARRRLFR